MVEFDPAGVAGGITLMEEVFIDVQENEKYYKKAVSAFRENPRVSARNKELVLRFLRDAALGKTVLNRAKKKIGTARLLNYIKELYFLIEYTDRNLDEIDQDGMESFIEALERNEIASRATMVYGKYPKDPAGLSERYRVDIKATIKKFYKWLWGNNRIYPEIVEWIDTYRQPAEVSALTESEIARVIDRSSLIKHKALIQVLFDGGFRIGELLNVRLRHVRMHWPVPTDPTKRCFLLRIPFSKTFPRTVALPMPATSKWLGMWLEDHPAKPTVLPDGSIEASDVNAPLFPMSLNAARLAMNRAGRRALSKRVYPHLIRHTSATFWANRLPYFKFCKRFGWTMTSAMPQRYIDREGIDELDIASEYIGRRQGQRLMPRHHPLS